MNLENVTVNKQSSVRIEGSKILYFDAFEITSEPHDADYVFVSHEHYDHFDPSSIERIVNENSIIIAPESMKSKLLKELSIDENKCMFCKPNDNMTLSSIRVETVPAYNNLKPFHTKNSKWIGYIINMDNVTYYFAGDTDVNEDVKKVKCDVAIIPIGGFYTMDKKQAAELIYNMRPKAAIPTHYGSIVGKAEDGMEFMSLLKKYNENIQVELKL